jgi:hypothetical protein
MTSPQVTRRVDVEGHGWPETGTDCEVCGWPTIDEPAHVTCRLDPIVGAAIGDRLRRPRPAPGQRLCTLCWRPLPPTVGPGVYRHLMCWQNAGREPVDAARPRTRPEIAAERWRRSPRPSP